MLLRLILRLLGGVLLLGACLANRDEVVAPPAPPVWVNLGSMVYHCPDTRYYGATSRGVFLGEPEAVRRGARPNGGRQCSDSTWPADTRPHVSASATSEPEECHLDRVIDGDTIRCAVQGTVRLIGVDAPESDQEPYGTLATEALTERLQGADRLRLEFEQVERDRYGRLLAHAWLGEELLGLWLVDNGWAVELSYAPNLRYAYLLAEAEARARERGVGLWGVGGLECRPLDHRQRRCP